MGLGLHRDHAAERRMLLPFAPPCRYDLPRSLPRNDARGMAGRTDGGGARWIGQSSRRESGLAGGHRADTVAAVLAGVEPGGADLSASAQAAGECCLRDDRGAEGCAHASVTAIVGSSEGNHPDDELSLVARRGHGNHATSIVKEYNYSLSGPPARTALVMASNTERRACTVAGSEIVPAASIFVRTSGTAKAAP